MLANNYVDVQDLVTGKYADFEAGTIVLGWAAALRILACLVTASDLAIVMHTPPRPRH